MDTAKKRAERVLQVCRLPGSTEVYAVGIFDDRVTVFTQQTRALNLAWGLIESGRVPTEPDGDRLKIAVIGAGFAGLTFAAAMLQKHARCHLTIFEERDTLVPLQQGSDTRWLHPHIYDWPAEGSEAAAAMLPVLNWTAARASDVVVQVLGAWSEVASPFVGESLELWCNTRHLQLAGGHSSEARLEWVGESRDPASGRALREKRNNEGRSETFDIVVLSLGFGLEARGSSYWRNEVFGQPGLEQRSPTYLVSGQGDGAMIDLLRLTVSQFRQDRILSEVFGGKNELIVELRQLRERFLAGSVISLYEEFDGLFQRDRNGTVASQMEMALKALAFRLRRDTQMILQMRAETRSVADLLNANTLKASFQNALLVYLLYKCGGFAPAAGEQKSVAERFKVPDTHIIVRHGTNRLELLDRLLPKQIFEPIAEAWKADRCKSYRQGSKIEWSGGYFGTPGRLTNFSALKEEEKAASRKEYLPGPTQLFATAVASAVAAHIRATRPAVSHLRVTVHRVITIHSEDLLQQACEYEGLGYRDPEPTSGRAFPVATATIGLAYRTRRIVRSRPRISRQELDLAMQKLKLNDVSRKMAIEVQFVAAIPVLQPRDSFYAPDPVCAVVYLDSRDPDFDLDEQQFDKLASIVSSAMNSARVALERPLDRLENTPLRAIANTPRAAESLPPDVSAEMTFVDASPPCVAAAFTLNVDHSDLTPLGVRHAHVFARNGGDNDGII